MSWPIGTIVVCVNADPMPDRHPDQSIAKGLYELNEGHHYTISAWLSGSAFVDGIAGVQVAEIPVRANEWFDFWRFKRVEGGACEAERARAMNTNKASK